MHARVTECVCACLHVWMCAHTCVRFLGEGPWPFLDSQRVQGPGEGLLALPPSRGPSPTPPCSPHSRESWGLQHGTLTPLWLSPAPPSSQDDPGMLVTSLLCSNPAVAPFLPTVGPGPSGSTGPPSLAWRLPGPPLHTPCSSTSFALAVPCLDGCSLSEPLFPES